MLRLWSNRDRTAGWRGTGTLRTTGTVLTVRRRELDLDDVILELVDRWRDLIPFFGPLMMRETGPRQLVDGPVLVSDTLDYCVVVVHYSADATAQ